MELLYVQVRERIQAQDRLGYWLDGIILAKRSRDDDGDKKQEVLVHFVGYKQRQDEWIEIGVGRLLALGDDTGALLDEEFQNTVGHVEEDQFEVDSIIKVRSRAGQFQFLIRWKGYSAKDDLWVAEDDVDPTSVAQFRALKKPRGASIPSGPYVLTVVDPVAPPSVCDALVKASMHLRLNPNSQQPLTPYGDAPYTLHTNSSPTLPILPAPLNPGYPHAPTHLPRPSRSGSKTSHDKQHACFFRSGNNLHTVASFRCRRALLGSTPHCTAASFK